MVRAEPEPAAGLGSGGRGQLITGSLDTRIHHQTKKRGIKIVLPEAPDVATGENRHTHSTATGTLLMNVQQTKQTPEGRSGGHAPQQESPTSLCVWWVVGGWGAPRGGSPLTRQRAMPAAPSCPAVRT